MGKPSGSTTTTVHNSPPQLMNEGRAGYEEANEFYRGILRNPPVYEGQRVADFTPAQLESMRQTREYFGRPQPYQIAGENQVYDTASGNYSFNPTVPLGFDEYNLGGTDYGLGDTDYGLGERSYGNLGVNAQGYQARITPAKANYSEVGWTPMTDEEIQKYVENASEPILANLEENVMPQIRESSQLAGQGATSTRSDVARQKAIEGYGRTVGSAVLAPLLIEQSRLQEDFNKSLNAYRTAIANGDADRANQASIEMNRISAASHDNANQINAQSSIEGARLQSNERIAGKTLQSGERRTGKELQSRERIASGGYRSQERQTAAGIEANTWDTERNRQLRASELVPVMLGSEGYRTEQLYNAGRREQDQAQRYLDSAREIFEEPLFRQSNAASALSSMAGVGPGSSTSIQKMQGSRDTYGDVMSGLGTAGSVVGAIAKLAPMLGFCSKQFKSEIETINEKDKEQIVNDILNIDIKKWLYNWDRDNNRDMKRTGPILEELPEWLREDELSVNLMAIISGAILTIQKHHTMLKELENKHVQTTKELERITASIGVINSSRKVNGP